MSIPLEDCPPGSIVKLYTGPLCIVLKTESGEKHLALLYSHDVVCSGSHGLSLADHPEDHDIESIVFTPDWFEIDRQLQELIK